RAGGPGVRRRLTSWSPRRCDSCTAPARHREPPQSWVRWPGWPPTAITEPAASLGGNQMSIYPAGDRTVLLASPRSFCAGVERAIAVVEQLLKARGAPIYARKQIVHNTHVVADLEARGAVFVEELDAVPDGATVVFSAHGVSPAVRAEAASRGLETIDA